MAMAYRPSLIRLLGRRVGLMCLALLTQVLRSPVQIEKPQLTL